eukprot:GILK01014420.1.p1 GENE.GILK01014420.1~~GILK01014420.1.p1  ORF type:complete len:444 (-),score=46.38 GILK01014420.1:46-1326(-)
MKNRRAPNGNWNFAQNHPLRSLFDMIARPLYATGPTKCTDDFVIEVQGKPAGTFRKPDIETLLKASRPSKFGQGDQDVMDESVRKGQEIVGVDLNIPSLPSSILNEVRAALFPRKQSISATLHKMTLYEKGGHFQYHRDTCYSPTHQGTLLVVLHSEHKGGELKLRSTIDQDAEEMTWNPGCGGYRRWVAFYTDIPHMLAPVTRGVRIALQYNLLVDDPVATQEAMQIDIKPNAAASDDGDYDDIQNELQQLYDSGHMTPANADGDTIVRFCQAVPQYLTTELALGIPLFHKYRPDALTIPTLKGVDAMLAVELEQTVSQARYCWSIVPVIYSFQYYEDHAGCGEEPMEVKPYFEQESLNKFTVEVIPHNTFNPRKLLRHQPYIEWTGNESQAREFQYVSAVLVLYRATSKEEEAADNELTQIANA